MLKFIKLSWLLILIIPGSSYSFDGDRRGFTVSFGLGIAPYAYWERDSIPMDNASVGLSLSFSLGYGWDSQNEVLLNLNFFLPVPTCPILPIISYRD
ncbi:MAG: hypothetical protein JXA92_02920 [candidate division Zixibacteria bacterium]|nr:hypothetical protein [candidate division Zixibacteria bacterium]